MAKPCSQSWVFNADQLSLQPDGTDRTLSLCDRVPPGRYALVRSVLSTGVAGYVNMARAHGFRGLIFVLGDDRESVDDLPEGRDKLVWAPSRSVASFAWQRHQQMLLDDVLPHDPLPGQFPGPYSARNGDLLVGAAFMCRAGSASNTAHAGQVMAEIRNRLGLDFVVADVDDPCWNYPGSGYAITSMVQAMQRTFRKSAHAVDRPRMSAHYPTFLITPGDPSNAPHMLSPDQAFEPVVNGYTAPFTFPAPRLSPNAGVYGAVRAWQWGRPIDSAGATAGAVQLTVDLRSGGNPSELVGLFTDENPAGGLTVSWSGLPTGFRSVNSGMIVYDDLAAVVAQGPANLGRVPTTYWDYDQGNVWGNIVPSWSPDPVPPLRVGQEFSDTTFGGLILELENWKSGHREVGTLPDVLTVTNGNCPPAKTKVRSRLKFDDL